MRNLALGFVVSKQVQYCFSHIWLDQRHCANRELEVSFYDVLPRLRSKCLTLELFVLWIIQSLLIPKFGYAGYLNAELSQTVYLTCLVFSDQLKLERMISSERTRIV